MATEDISDAIRRRAEEIYVRNGRVAGRDVENWIQAEREILSEAASRQPHRTAVVVKVDGVQIVGEYTPGNAEGYTPGEFAQGVKVPVRFEGEKMFVKRPNGRELETTIVKKIG